MSNSGTSYPRVYGTSKITDGGSMGIPLYGGTSKTPDHSMYNILAGREYSDVQDSCIPTIVFEVAYTQSSRDLAENAARHICLTLGQVLLVVAIDIIRTKDEPKRLFSVTWSHWEEDVNARKLIVPNLDNGDDNMVRAEREGDEDDEEHILPPAKAFSATVCIRDIITSEDERHHIRATETQRWQVSCKTLHRALTTNWRCLAISYPRNRPDRNFSPPTCSRSCRGRREDPCLQFLNI